MDFKGFSCGLKVFVVCLIVIVVSQFFLSYRARFRECDVKLGRNAAGKDSRHHESRNQASNRCS